MCKEKQDNNQIPQISIVTTMYYSSSYVKEFYEQIFSAINTLSLTYEIIFVDDGSPDDSLARAIEVSKLDSNVKILELSRNFGHHKAMMTGLEYSKGELIFLLDIDLEESPQDLSLFWNELNKIGADVVYGVQQYRKGGFFEKITGSFFYTLFNILSPVKITPNASTIRLMKRNYVDALVQHKDREVFMFGLFKITGFKQVAIEIQKTSTSPTTYTMWKKVMLFINSIVSFSEIPLFIMFFIGLIILAVSIIASSFIVYSKITHGYQLGWASTIVTISFFGGLLTCFQGVTGIYIAKILSETKRRPYSIIRNVHSS